MPCSRMPKWRLRPAKSPRVDRRRVLDARLGRGLEVGAAADQRRAPARRPSAARRCRARASRAAPVGRRGEQPLEQVRRHAALDASRPSARARSGSAARQRVERSRRHASYSGRSAVGARARSSARTSSGTRNVGDSGQPSARLAAGDLLGAERLAVRLARVLLVRRAVADVAAARSRARALGLGDRRARAPRATRVAVVGVGALRRASRRPRSASATSSLNASAVSPSIVMWLSS